MNVRRKVQQTWQALSSRERRILRAFAKGSLDAGLRCRCKIVLSMVRGESPTRIAEGGLSSESQVYRVARRFIDEGPAGLADRREDNGEAKVTEEYEAELIEVVGKSPRNYGYRRPTWTQELLLLVLARRTGVRISCTTMSRVLKRLRIRLGRPKPIVGCPWKKARKTRRLRTLTRLIETLPKDEVVVYVDEVDIHLNPKIGPDWMLRGTQKTVLTPGKNEKRYLAGALNARTGQLTWVEGERKTSLLFIWQLWYLIQRDYPKAKRIHLILDNYRIHSSRQVELVLAKLGDRVQLHFLPPYCPDHNRIERVWRDLHANVTRNHQCRTMNELMKEVRWYLRKRDKELRRSYAAEKANLPGLRKAI
jgi:transposase